MAKKIEINENWEPVEVEDLDNLFVVIFKHGSFEQGYVEAFDTNDVLMQSAYDSLAKQYDDCGCDELTKIYLIKVPNTKQTVDMCNTGLFNGNCCDPHVIEATRELFNRADCEQLSCWEGCGLTEAKKKKKRNKNKVIIPGGYLTVTTGDPALNIKHFNNCMGTGGLQNPDAPHLVVGDTLPNGPIADSGAGDVGSGDSGAVSGGEGGGMGESLKLKEDWKRFNYKDYNGDEVVTVAIIDKRFEPLFKKDQREILKKHNVRIEGHYINGTVVIGKVNDIIQVCDECHIMNPHKIFTEAAAMTEAHLDYSKQLDKMRQLENGTRGFNAASASLEKILFNYDICISNNLPRARKVMEDALRMHGWDNFIKPAKTQVNISDFDPIFNTGHHINNKVKIVLANKDNAQQLLTDYGNNLVDLLAVLIIALGIKEATLAGIIKDHIIKNFTITLAELKDFLNRYFANPATLSSLNKVIHDCKESLVENTVYSHKLRTKFKGKLDEAKRYVKRYYVRPLNIFCGNKEDIIQALIRAGDQNCSVYSLKNLTDHEDVHLLQPSDIIYYWDDHVLYDKNHVQVMDYDLFVKHEEERKKVGNIDAVSDAAFSAMYDDRATEDDLKDKEVIANYKALNKISR